MREAANILPKGVFANRSQSSSHVSAVETDAGPEGASPGASASQRIDPLHDLSELAEEGLDEAILSCVDRVEDSRDVDVRWKMPAKRLSERKPTRGAARALHRLCSRGQARDGTSVHTSGVRKADTISLRFKPPMRIGENRRHRRSEARVARSENQLPRVEERVHEDRVVRNERAIMGQARALICGIRQRERDLRELREERVERVLSPLSALYEEHAETAHGEPTYRVATTKQESALRDPLGVARSHGLRERGYLRDYSRHDPLDLSTDAESRRKVLRRDSASARAKRERAESHRPLLDETHEPVGAQALLHSPQLRCGSREERRLAVGRM